MKMKRSVLAFALSLVTYFGFGQCGPYIATITNSSCNINRIAVSGASEAAKIVWLKNGVPFDTVSRGALGITLAGGNGAGSALNQINEPTGVWLDTAGNIYVQIKLIIV